MLSTSDVLRLTGYKNGKTLTRLARNGIIAKPHIDLHPNGRGKQGYYPSVTVQQIRVYRQAIAARSQRRAIERLVLHARRLGLSWPTPQQVQKDRL